MIVDHRFSRTYQHGQVELWGGLFWCYSLHINLDTSARSAYRLKTSCTAKQTQQTIIKRSHTKPAGKADRCVKKGAPKGKEPVRNHALSGPAAQTRVMINTPIALELIHASRLRPPVRNTDTTAPHATFSRFYLSTWMAPTEP